MPDNSFLHPLGQVAFGEYRPEDVDEAMAQGEARAWELVRTSLAVPAEERTFDNTVLALAEAAEQLATIRSLVNHHAQVLGGPWHPVNEAATEVEARLRNQLRFHQGIYGALLEVRDRPGQVERLSAPQRKYLDELVLKFERDGIALAEDQQQQLKDIAAEISAAEVTFTRQMVQAQDDAGLAVADRAELEGLSEEFIATSRAAAEAKGLDGYWVTYNYPNQRYLMANCRVRATRQGFHRMFVDIASGPNLPVAQQLLALRRRMAGLLGYRDYSDYALELRMAKDGATAADFVTSLTELYHPAAEVEHQELVAFGRQLEADPGLELDASDVGMDVYLPAQLRASQVGVDEETLRDYLALDHVKDVMFSTIGALYGFELRRVSAQTWHPDVEVYQIWDGDRHFSTVWCDWYARPGKVSGAWADAFYAAPRAGGRVTSPTLGCVVCNFPPPDSSGHSRLSIRDVEILWHEFGHFLHFTCSMTQLRQQGALACRWDFIEAPSQIMENWVWQRQVLSRMAVHYGTGEPLSDGVLAGLLASRQFRAASASMRQLTFASEDLALHREYQGDSADELFEYHHKVVQPFHPVPLYTNDAMIASFNHIFGGDEYASAYYSYKWAEAIEADLFSAFQPDKLLSREVGLRYREEVLARGAEVEPDELVRGFLGRDSDPRAMLERDGVAVKGATRTA